MDKLTKQAIEGLTKRRWNIKRLVNALNDECNMLDACHRRLIEKYYEEDLTNINNANRMKMNCHTESNQLPNSANVQKGNSGGKV